MDDLRSCCAQMMATSHMLNDSRVVGNIYVHYMYDYRIDYSDVSA